jgi:serine/threonine protein phosphatase 1
VIGRFFKSLAARKAEAPPPAGPRVPEGQRVYAIGDIHGRADLLERLLELIAADTAKARPAETTLIYLGDYIDRGPASREVVDIARAPHPMVDRVVRLRGNHEEAMLTFIADFEMGRLWLDYGGMATLHSYGVRLAPGLSAQERFAAMASQLDQAIPPEHRDFYDRLSLSETIGDYFFVHAGINPYQPIAEQDPFEMTTIRSPFIEWGRPLEKVVVHGHTIAPEAEFRSWRIGIDTGAYATGHLTCLVLEGGGQRLITT